MAKAPAKKAATPAGKKTPKKTTATGKKPEGASIESVSETALSKLKALNLDPQLQADLEWCLGSFRHDGNPVGLTEMCGRALQVFRTELARKTKGVTAKWVAELEKATGA